MKTAQLVFMFLVGGRKFYWYAEYNDNIYFFTVIMLDICYLA